MLATVWSPTWVIDGRDPARTPQPHERKTRWWKRSTTWACKLCPRSGVGGAWLFAMPQYRDAPQPGALGSALYRASPWRQAAVARVLNSKNGGSYVTGTWNRIHFVHRTGQ